ncbi:hypothetical protein [Moheibacter sp.]|uniref:hypothetical protein n=1 Tax=Moheibacter sp. TaxID=1965316 RepID=UPI003C72CD3F
MRLRKFILPIALVISSIAFSQQKSYNLPPGYYLDTQKHIFDLSHKLEGNYDYEVSVDKLKFLKEVSSEELNQTSPEYQQYIKEMNEFVNGLSRKIRDIYSLPELWYVYAFDQELKQRLQTIK